MYDVCPICGCIHDDGMLSEIHGFLCMDCADSLPENWRKMTVEELRALRTTRESHDSSR